MTYKERLRGQKKNVHKTTFGWEIIHHLQNQQGGSTMDDDELLNLQKRASNATCPTSPMPNNSKAPREVLGGISTPAGKGSHRGRRADDGTKITTGTVVRRRLDARGFPFLSRMRAKAHLSCPAPFFPVQNAGSVGSGCAVPPWHSLGQLGSSCGMAGSADRRGTLTKTIDCGHQSILARSCFQFPSRRPARK